MEVIATEINWSHLCVKQENNLEFRLSDNESTLPLSDNEVEAITIIDVLHHANNETSYNIIKECYRALKPNGKLIMIENSFPLMDKINHSEKYIRDFVSLSTEEKILIYIFIELFSHKVITKTNMPMALNIKPLLK